MFVFCGGTESIDHKFLTCPVAKYLWNVVCCAFNISKVPVSMQQIASWILSFNGKNCRLMAIGITALCWAICKARNLACFQSVVLKILLI